MPGRMQQASASSPTTGTVRQEAVFGSLLRCVLTFIGIWLWRDKQVSECTGKMRSSCKEPTHNITSAFPCLGGFSLPEMFPGGLPCDVNLFFYLVHNPVSLQTQPFSKAAQNRTSILRDNSEVFILLYAF